MHRSPSSPFVLKKSILNPGSRHERLEEGGHDEGEGEPTKPEVQSLRKKLDVEQRLARIAGGIFSKIELSPSKALLACAAVVVLALPALAFIDVDLSFRPLFSQDEELAETTAAIQTTFAGLPSAPLGILIEAPDVLDESVLRSTHELEQGLRNLSGVKSVVSPLSLPLPGVGKDAWIFSLPCAPGADEGCRRELERAHRTLPEFSSQLVSKDRTALLIWVDLEASIFDLSARREVMKKIDELALSSCTDFTTTNVVPHGYRLVGYSVVEDAYEVLLKKSAAQAGLLTLLAIFFVLMWLYRSPRAIVVALAGVSLGLVFCACAAAVFGWPITMVSAAIPTLLLMVGVADSIHSLSAFTRRRQNGESVQQSARATYVELFLPCTLTTLTTVAGFASLGFAQLPIVSSFGFAAAVGVFAVHAFNFVCVPALLLLWPPPLREKSHAESEQNGKNLATVALDRLCSGIAKAPLAISLGGLVVFGGLSVFALDLEVSQYFNREVAPDHPVRAAQQDLEDTFAGFLGPDLLIQRADGESVVDEETLVAIHHLAQRLRKLEDVGRVLAPTDIVDVIGSEGAVPSMLWPMAVEQMLNDDNIAANLVSPKRDAALILVRTGDLGTERAVALIERIEVEVERSRPRGLIVKVGGTWVQAQRGMSVLVNDMLSSFLVALLLVLPFLFFAARKWPLFLAALLPNVVPMTCALGAMALAGVPLRIGTAVVCAVALGIAVDDTLHLVHALRHRRQRDPSATDEQVLRGAMGSAGQALLVTSTVLVAGFLALSLAELHVMRDMGRLGALALGLAFIADMVWLPALWLMATGAKRRR